MSRNSNKIIYILQTSTQYQSDAAYNRVRLFCQGINENNVYCEIFRIEFPKRVNGISKVAFLVKNTIRLIFKLLTLSKTDVVIVYGETYFTFLYKLIAHKAKIVFERTEYPAFILNQSLSSKSKKNSIKNYEIMRTSEQLITCSNFLAQFYSKYTPNSIVLPLIIDNKEFKIRDSSHKDNIISYCGSFDNNKDGIPTLLRAFSLFKEKYPSYKLVLMGAGSPKEMAKINNLLVELNIADNVTLTGKISHQAVINQLCESSMLVLARPSNKQAEGGIPSKVGEYISTGVPCVITNVGELHFFMKDGVNCYMSEPDSSEEFFKKMIECAESDNTEIIKNAVALSQTFYYKNVSKQLIVFLGETCGFSYN